MDWKACHRRNINWFRTQRGKWGGKLLGRAPASPPYDPQSVAKILLLRNDNKLGDSVACSALLRGLRGLFPSASIDVVSGKTNRLLFQHHPFVRRIFMASRSFYSLAWCAWKLKKEKYDLYLDLDETPTFSSLVFLRILRPRWAVGFNRNDCALYNLNLHVDISSLHITGRQEAVLRALGMKGPFDPSYDVYYPTALSPETNRFIARLPAGKAWMMINPLAASKYRSLTPAQVEALAREFAHQTVILIGPAPKLAKWLGQRTLPTNCYVYKGDLFQAFALAKRAAWLITPDTFWVHAACALKIPTLAIYHWGKDPQGPYDGNVAVWRPLEPCVKMILRPERQCDIPVPALLQAVRQSLGNSPSAAPGR